MDLGYDFPGVEAPPNAQCARGTEGTAHSTTDLTGHTERHSFPSGDQNRLNLGAVSKSDYELLRTVARGTGAQ